MTSPLNPQLYDMLEASFGRVQITNEGIGQVAKYRRDPFTGRERLEVIESGEYYRVNCPFCNDTRYRLWINHKWAMRDETGRQNLWLAYCYNENCLASSERRVALLDRITDPSASLGEARLRPGKKVDPKKIEADWPGPVTRVDKLPETHEAVEYLVSRLFNPKTIGRVYNVHYCHDSFRWLARGRLIIPLYIGKKMVGWQARYVGETNWKAENAPPKYYTCPGTPRRKVIYNIAKAAQYQTGVIVEGPTDVWAFGPMACCTLGATMTPDQQRTFLLRFRDYAAVLLYDWDARDKPGTRKIEHAFSGQFARGFCKVVLPEGHDPGSLDRGFLRDFVAQEARKAGVVVSWQRR